jgi:beta-xylosidase
MFGADEGAIMQVPIDPDQGEVLDAPRQLWSGTGLAAPEAPHLYRIDGQWYLLIAEGGTERGHAVSVARAPAATGPFHGYQANPILSHRSTGSPIQNTGHGDLVQAADGSWRLVLLGVRPRGGTPRYHVLGRETFLTPVSWVDGWPVPQPVSPGDPAAGQVEERDDFDGAALAPYWLSIRERPPHAYSLEIRPGWLTLHATGGSLDDPLPSFVGRRQQHPGCRVRVRVDPGAGRGGLAVRLDERHHYRIEATAGEVRCVARIGPLATQVATRPAGAGPVVLVIDIDAGPVSPGAVGTGPDVVRLGLEADGRFEPLAELDGRYLSTEVAGGFTGRVIGMYAAEGTAAFDWYEYVSVRDP